MKFSLLNAYIALILVIKVIFLIRIVQLSYYRFFKPKNQKMISFLIRKKEEVDWYFFTLTFGLMIYLFNLRSKKDVSVGGHEKLILFACGLVGLIHQLQLKFEI
tara:strand:- start:18 stop:329 length:312 start_codon:yes stop_codon:yes gene_type:complete